MRTFFRLFITLLLCLTLIITCACSNDSANTSSQLSDISSEQSSVDSTSKTASTVSRMTESEIVLQGYMPNSWNSSLSKIKQNSVGKFVFALQSDTHFYDLETRETGVNLKSLAYFTDMQFIGNLGDLIRGYSQDIDNPNNMRACMDSLVERYTLGGKAPVLMTIGNHDANHMWSEKHTPGDHTTLITEKEHYSRVIAPLKAHNGDNMVTNGESTYYYMDFPDSKVRVIMLNTSDDKYSEHWGNGNAMSDEQVNWFKTVALDTDYSVIVMSHIPFVRAFEEGKNSISVKSEAILSAVEEFIATGGTFIAYMHGHTHTSETIVDDNGRVHLTLINTGNSGKYAEVFFIDLQNRTVETMGLGGIKDRSFRY